jgi:HEAT repeat protein
MTTARPESPPDTTLRRRRLVRRLAVYVPLATIGMVLLAHPYTRQWLLGQTIEGEPVWYWQQTYRQQHAPEEREQSVVTRLARLVGLSDTWGTGRAVPLKNPAMGPVLVGLLSDSNDKVRAAALTDIPWNRDVPGLREALLPLLEDPSPRVRRVALLRLHDVGRAADLPRIVPRLHDPDFDCRLTAALVVHHFEPDSPVALAVVRQALNDPDPRTRDWGAGAAGSMAKAGGTRARQEFFPLVVAHVLADPAHRDLGIIGLSHFGPDAVPTLLKLLDSDDPAARLNAARAFGYMGAPAKDAEPALVRHRDDPAPDVRQAVGWSLFLMDPKRYPDPRE